jgi:uncharacterized protein YjiK
MMNIFKYSCLVFAIISLTGGCKEPKTPKNKDLPVTAPVVMLNYDLSKPVSKFILPEVLHEISGITWHKPGVLICVQDESGFVYDYDLGQKKITKTVPFGKPGDYEDLAVAGNELYVVRSDGHLYQFPIGDAKQVEPQKFKTPLTSENEIENLCYDSSVTQKILLGCKNKGGINGNKVKGRAIYSFDLQTGTLDEAPYMVIDLNALQEAVSKAGLAGGGEFNFKPSAMAVHPVSKDIYMIASVGSLMVVADRTGKIKEVVRLEPRLFTQPEGICFAPDGTLFISSEAGDKISNGYILQFNYSAK